MSPEALRQPIIETVEPPATPRLPIVDKAAGRSETKLNLHVFGLSDRHLSGDPLPQNIPAQYGPGTPTKNTPDDEICKGRSPLRAPPLSRSFIHYF
jgi:hypothetical protein